MTSYLDHATLSPLRPEVLATLHEVLELPQADPGRPYDDAMVVRRLIEDSRQAVADLAHITARQVIFTASIAESVATALHGLAQGGTIASSNTERSSVLESAAAFGAHFVLGVDGAGHLDLEEVENCLKGQAVALLCCQLANHETGTLDDVFAITEIAHRYGTRVHVDASVGFGKVPCDFGILDADAVSVAGELLGGPTGTAALLVRKGIPFESFLLGGAQERGRRAGLENILGIVGMGVAASVLSEPGVLEREASQAAQQIAAIESAALRVEGVTAIGDPAAHRRAPHLRCFSVAGVEAEPVLMGLNRAGVAVHSGSACSSETFEPSPVLAAMGLEADRSMRVSVGWSTTEHDIDRFASQFGPVVTQLRELGH